MNRLRLCSHFHSLCGLCMCKCGWYYYEGFWLAASFQSRVLIYSYPYFFVLLYFFGSMSALMLTWCAQSEAWNGKWWRKNRLLCPSGKNNHQHFRIRAYCIPKPYGSWPWVQFIAGWFPKSWWKSMMDITIRGSLVLSGSRTYIPGTLRIHLE